MVGGIICTHSRGAILSMIVAGVTTVAVVVRTRRSTAWIVSMGLAMLAGAALVAWLGMSDSVENRMATLLDRSLMQQTRIPHWRDAVRAVPDFWRTGSGLGSYAYVYPQYQQRLDGTWYVHAGKPLPGDARSSVALGPCCCCLRRWPASVFRLPA